MNTYLIPGLGGDKRMYAGQLARFSDTKVLEFIPPLGKESISSYALRLAEGIDKTKPFILIGVSLGGILSQEIAKHYKPEKVILISSVKERRELPVWMRIFRFFPMQKMIPGKFYLWMFFVLMWVKSFRMRANPILANLRNMAKDANPDFVYWAVHQVITWKAPIANFQCYRIHGNDDFLFPLRRCSGVDKVVENGTHAMILTHVKEINTSLSSVLP